MRFLCSTSAIAAPCLIAGSWCDQLPPRLLAGGLLGTLTQLAKDWTRSDRLATRTVMDVPAAPEPAEPMPSTFFDDLDSGPTPLAGAPRKPSSARK